MMIGEDEAKEIVKEVVEGEAEKAKKKQEAEKEKNKAKGGFFSWFSGKGKKPLEEVKGEEAEEEKFEDELADLKSQLLQNFYDSSSEDDFEIVDQPGKGKGLPPFVNIQFSLP